MENKERNLKILRIFCSILIYGLAIKVMDISLWKSLLAGMLIVLGVHIQNGR